MKNPGLTVSTSEDTRRPSFSAPSMSSPPPAPVLQGAAIRKSCASQRCLSPSSTVSTSPSTGGARDGVASPRGSPALRSPSLTTRSAREAPSSPSSTGGIGSATKSPTSPTGAGKPMSMETYFRLLKKAQVLEKLLSMNSHLHSSEEQLRKLQTEKAKTDTVQQRVFVELEAYQKQYVDVQRFFLELLESMTLLCLKEEQLQLGSSADTALRHAELAAEEKTLQDLQDATLAIGRTKPSNGALCSSPVTSMSSASSLESQVLLAVGRARLKQMEQICASYERQLVNCDAELTRAMQSTFTKECLDKIAASEAREREHEQEKAMLLERIESLERQNAELTREVASHEDANAQLESDRKRVESQRLSEQRAIEQFASDLKSELRKRYGVVPSVLELRWHQYFPTLPMPT